MTSPQSSLSGTHRAGITLLGLGPGNPEQLTRRAWHIIQHAAEILLRTRQHPTVAAFPDSVVIHDFDAYYQSAENFEDVYEKIVAEVLERGQRPQGVIYAVPGHPLLAEATGTAIFHQARQAGLDVDVVDGLSFLEPLQTALGLDLFPQTTIVDAFEVIAGLQPPFPTSAPAVIAQLHSRAMASDLKLTLMAAYPDDHPVQLAHAAGTSAERVESLRLYELDRSQHIGLLSCLHVPALGAYTSLPALQQIVARLRAPDGCPWDRAQTHLSMRPHLLEETYEVLEALDAEDPVALVEELGDLLFQIVFHAQMASESGDFAMAQVISGIAEKLIRRHPHVFGDADVQGIEGVLANWDQWKAAEKEQDFDHPHGPLAGLPAGLPALAQAQASLQRLSRAALQESLSAKDLDRLRANIESLISRFQAETETQRGANGERMAEGEIGEMLFSLVQLSEALGVDAESALRVVNARLGA